MSTSLSFPRVQILPVGVSQLWHSSEPRLRDSTVFLFVLLGAMLLLATIDDRTLYGVNVWSKPSKFALSFGVQLGTLSILWRALPSAYHTSWGASAIVRTLILMSVLEVGYIAARAAAGLPSHFAEDTTLAFIAYNLMGVGASTVVLLTAWLGVRVLKERGYREPLRLGIGFGLILSGLLGLVTGVTLAINNGSLVGIPSPDAAVWPLFGWSREVGDLRPAHFLGQHAMQILPLLGLFVMGWKTAAANGLIWGAGLVLTIATIGLIVLAFAGIPL